VSSKNIHLRALHGWLGVVAACAVLFAGCITPPPPPFVPLSVSEIPLKLGGLAGMQWRKDLMPGKSDEEVSPLRPASEVLQPGATYVIDAYDPLEGMNRQMYILNALFDVYLFLPLVRGYEFITPIVVKKGISNFFDNLGELSNLTNTLLQLKFKPFAITAARFSYNTTCGLLGIFDLATQAGLKRQNEDFGQTLGYYCIGPGPYLVLPIFGPSTLRDTGGLAFDTAVYTLITNRAIDEMGANARQEDLLKFGFTVLNGIDKRRRQSFRYYETGSPFEYELIRLLYLRKREFEIIQ
jgi:phospholipid-binding lipoprotein MlaA